MGKQIDELNRHFQSYLCAVVKGLVGVLAVMLLLATLWVVGNELIYQIQHLHQYRY